MFFVAAGKVDHDAPDQAVSFSAGQCFGAEAMLHNDVHKGAFITGSRCKLLKLLREDFHRLEASHPDVAAHIRRQAETP